MRRIALVLMHILIQPPSSYKSSFSYKTSDGAETHDPSTHETLSPFAIYVNLLSFLILLRYSSIHLMWQMKLVGELRESPIITGIGPTLADMRQLIVLQSKQFLRSQTIVRLRQGIPGWEESFPSMLAPFLAKGPKPLQQSNYKFIQHDHQKTVPEMRPLKPVRNMPALK